MGRLRNNNTPFIPSLVPSFSLATTSRVPLPKLVVLSLLFFHLGSHSCAFSPLALGWGNARQTWTGRPRHRELLFSSNKHYPEQQQQQQLQRFRHLCMASTTTSTTTTTSSRTPEHQSNKNRRTPPSSTSTTTTRRRHRGRYKQRRGDDDNDRWIIRQMFQRAKRLERQGKWRRATDVLEDILVRDPQDAYSHLALARLEGRRNKTSAVGAFRRGTRACPNSVHLWQAWAVHEESRGNPSRARELFEKALGLDPYNPYVCHAYGLMEKKQHNTTAARGLWEKALQKTSTAALVCSLGQLFIEGGDLDQAHDLYVRHVMRLQSKRERTEVYLALAWLEERHRKSFDRAEELIKLALELDPKSSVAQVALARLEGRRYAAGPQRESQMDAVTRRLARTCREIENGETTVAPSDGRVYNAWASLEVKSKRYTSARRILSRGVQRYPRDHSLLQAAGRVEERLRNFSAAREYYCESLKIHPSAPTLVAYALLELKHPESGTVNFTMSQRLFEEALLVDPRHGPAYNSYGNAELRRGNLDAAREIFERGVRAKCSDAASVYHGYAKLELSLGDVPKARLLLQKGLNASHRQDLSTDSPHRERALFLTHTLGMLELNSDNSLTAQGIFEDGIERYGNSSQLLLGAALSAVKMGREGAARSLFERSVLADESHGQAWQAWGVMEMRAGQLETAQTLLECGIRSCPRHGALWLAYATLEGRRGKPDEARKFFMRGIHNSPNHAPLYQAWASLELREGNIEQARVLITEALTRDKHSGTGWLVAAEIESESGNAGLVILLLRRGLECAPSHADLYRALGEKLVSTGRLGEARQVFERGIDIDPLYAPMYHSLAELEARLGNVEGLSKLNKRAADLFKTNALDSKASRGEEAWSKKIKAGRSRRVPLSVTTLADRIVEENPEVQENTQPTAFIEELGSTLLENGLIGDLLKVDEFPDSEPKQSCSNNCTAI